MDAPKANPAPLPQAVAWIAGSASVLGVALLLDAPRWLIAGLLVLLASLGVWAAFVARSRDAAERRRLAAAIDQLPRVAASSSEPDSTGRVRTAATVLQRELAADGQQRATLAGALNALDHPVLVTTETGETVFLNPAAETWLNLPSPKALGRSVDEILTYAELLRLHTLAREGRVIREQIRVSRAEGTRIVDVAARKIASELAGPLVVTSIRDVSEQSRAIQVRADFVANASHELRTPIAAMRVAIDTLEALDEGDAQERSRFLAIVASNIERLEEMIRDLLDLSRLESPEAQLEIAHCRGSELRSTLAGTFDRACQERDLAIEWDLDPALEGMLTDRKLLLLILQNLIENSTKFAYEGSVIRVVGRPAGEGGVRLEVADRGIGIPLGQQQRIFERFYQVNAARTGVGASRRGTGLGLAIVKHAVKRLSGTIRVQSVWKEGTTMIVELPGVLPPGAQAGAA